MQFFISFNGNSNEENDFLKNIYEPATIDNQQRLGVDLFIPKTTTIESINNVGGLPAVIDLKIIVSLLNMDIYNATPPSINEELEFTKELNSLTPFIVMPSIDNSFIDNSQSLLSSVLLCKYELEENGSNVAHGKNIKLRIYNLSENAITIQAGTIVGKLLTAYRRTLKTSLKIISKDDFMYSEAFIEKLIEHGINI